MASAAISGEALGRQARAQPRDVQLHVDHDKIGALTGPERGQRSFDVIDVGNLGAPLQRDLAGGCDMPFE
jgi:hypothetical protein